MPYEDGTLEVYMALLSKYALQLRVHGRRFDRVRERHGTGRTEICILASSMCMQVLALIATPKRTECELQEKHFRLLLTYNM